ncbi:MAG: RraA family protein [Acidobacteriia bacterium]|nr:RraA family protein [Methyloceanibacter sp.]MBX5471132.1 RraA family protein [Acetobacteraceae bacterium]MCL6490914.1 RraA family protein [Terriglobia bacterium]
MEEDIANRLKRCPTAVVHDVMLARGLRDFTLPHELRPIMPDESLAGPAFTVEGSPAPGTDADTTLLAWTWLLSQSKPAHVWVLQPHDRTVAHMGELSAQTLKSKGVLGCVLDGGARDVAALRAMRFPTWCRYFTPRDIVAYWMPKAIEQDIRIGDVIINPGDYILGDCDGLVRVPSGLAKEIVVAAEQTMTSENRVRSAILNGMDPQEAYRTFGKF